MLISYCWSKTDSVSLSVRAVHKSLLLMLKVWPATKNIYRQVNATSGPFTKKKEKRKNWVKLICQVFRQPCSKKGWQCFEFDRHSYRLPFRTTVLCLKHKKASWHKTQLRQKHINQEKEKKNDISHPLCYYCCSCTCRCLTTVTLTNRDVLVCFQWWLRLQWTFCVWSCRGQPGSKQQPDNRHPSTHLKSVFDPNRKQTPLNSCPWLMILIQFSKPVFFSFSPPEMFHQCCHGQLVWLLCAGIKGRPAWWVLGSSVSRV